MWKMDCRVSAARRHVMLLQALSSPCAFRCACKRGYAMYGATYLLVRQTLS